MNAEIYTKNDCPYCVRAKALLQKHNVDFTEINAVEHRSALIARVTDETGSPPKTVPQIWLDGKYVGGYDQLAELF